jgi:thioester reductase-like protein
MINLADLDILHNDAKLNTKIQFPHALSSDWKHPKAVFLTGATGFLGAYLLFELLQKTSADIYCLVRAEDNEAGLERLKQKLAFYQRWQSTFQTRIIPVVGDLAKPSFSLTESVFEQLASTIDVIYHNGAQVNATYAYSRLKASNVDGTETILRLAGLKQTKPVHFISSLAVFFIDDNQHKTILEEDIPRLDASMKGGYKQTKWVAETLVRVAQQRGLPATIYRPGRIWGDSQHVTMDRFSDLLLNLIQGGIHLGAYPNLDNVQVNMAPVDYVSQAIVALSLRSPKNNKLQAFHLNNPCSVDWNTLWAWIQSLGYSLHETNFEQWSEQIVQCAQQSEKQHKRLYLVLRHLLRSPIYIFSQKPSFDTRRVEKHLQHHPIQCPIFDKKLLHMYLQAFQKSNYVPMPK